MISFFSNVSKMFYCRSLFLFRLGRFLLAFLSSSLLVSAAHVSLWDEKTIIIDDMYFTLEYPQNWVEFSYKSPGIDYVFQTKDVVVWPSNYNGVNTIGTFYVWRDEDRSEDEAIQHILKAPNRAGHSLFSYIENYKGRHLNGKLIVSHFGKYFGARNGVRYDLLTYSLKRQQFYGFTLLIQYMKGSQDFAKEYNTQAYACKIFEHIKFKS